MYNPLSKSKDTPQRTRQRTHTPRPFPDSNDPKPNHPTRHSGGRNPQATLSEHLPFSDPLPHAAWRADQLAPYGNAPCHHPVKA